MTTRELPSASALYLKRAVGRAKRVHALSSPEGQAIASAYEALEQKSSSGGSFIARHAKLTALLSATAMALGTASTSHERRTYTDIEKGCIECIGELLREREAMEGEDAVKSEREAGSAGSENATLDMHSFFRGYHEANRRYGKAKKNDGEYVSDKVEFRDRGAPIKLKSESGLFTERDGGLESFLSSNETDRLGTLHDLLFALLGSPLPTDIEHLEGELLPLIQRGLEITDEEVDIVLTNVCTTIVTSKDFAKRDAAHRQSALDSDPYLELVCDNNREVKEQKVEDAASQLKFEGPEKGSVLKGRQKAQRDFINSHTIKGRKEQAKRVILSPAVYQVNHHAHYAFLARTLWDRHLHATGSYVEAATTALGKCLKTYAQRSGIGAGFTAVVELEAIVNCFTLKCYNIFAVEEFLDALLDRIDASWHLALREMTQWHDSLRTLSDCLIATIERFDDRLPMAKPKGAVASVIHCIEMTAKVHEELLSHVFPFVGEKMRRKRFDLYEPSHVSRLVSVAIQQAFKRQWRQIIDPILMDAGAASADGVEIEPDFVLREQALARSCERLETHLRALNTHFIREFASAEIDLSDVAGRWFHAKLTSLVVSVLDQPLPVTQDTYEVCLALRGAHEALRTLQRNLPLIPHMLFAPYIRTLVDTARSQLLEWMETAVVTEDWKASKENAAISVHELASAMNATLDILSELGWLLNEFQEGAETVGVFDSLVALLRDSTIAYADHVTKAASDVYGHDKVAMWIDEVSRVIRHPSTVLPNPRVDQVTTVDRETTPWWQRKKTAPLTPKKELHEDKDAFVFVNSLECLRTYLSDCIERAESLAPQDISDKLAPAFVKLKETRGQLLTTVMGRQLVTVPDLILKCLQIPSGGLPEVACRPAVHFLDDKLKAIADIIHPTLLRHAVALAWEVVLLSLTLAIVARETANFEKSQLEFLAEKLIDLFHASGEGLSAAGCDEELKLVMLLGEMRHRTSLELVQVASLVDPQMILNGTNTACMPRPMAGSSDILSQNSSVVPENPWRLTHTAGHLSRKGWALPQRQQVLTLDHLARLLSTRRDKEARQWVKVYKRYQATTLRSTKKSSATRAESNPGSSSDSD